jgi:Fe-S-cluster containining protein
MLPEEASRAIADGRAGRLMLDWWEPSDELGNEDRIYLLCPAAEDCEGCFAPIGDFLEMALGLFEKGQCTFLKAGKCEIHDSGFKPLECRTAHHDREDEELPLDERASIAAAWMTDRGRQIVAEWKTLVNIDEGSQP